MNGDLNGHLERDMMIFRINILLKMTLVLSYVLKGYSTFFKVEQLGFTVFECIQLIF